MLRSESATRRDDEGATRRNDRVESSSNTRVVSKQALQGQKEIHDVEQDVFASSTPRARLGRRTGKRTVLVRFLLFISIGDRAEGACEQLLSLVVPSERYHFVLSCHVEVEWELKDIWTQVAIVCEQKQDFSPSFDFVFFAKQRLARDSKAQASQEEYSCSHN